VDATVERDTVYVPSDSVVTTVVETVVEYRDRALTRWERIKQEVGGWALGAGVFSVTAFVVWLVFKLK
jgi:hypothetical protein